MGKRNSVTIESGAPFFLTVVEVRWAAGQSRLVKRGPICNHALIGLRVMPNWCGENGNPAAMKNIETAASYAKMEDSFTTKESSIFIYIHVYIQAHV
jgi:hypothetical protein